jgi:hypothetical protein
VTWKKQSISTSNGLAIHIETYGPYMGDGTSGILFWGPQLEIGTTPTSYIPTSGAPATRVQDVYQQLNQ